MNSRRPTNAVKKRANLDLPYNVLTLVFILITLGLCIVFGTIFSDPYSTLNPFPPATATPTITPTPLGFESTWTPTLTQAPTETITPRPSITIPPTSTLFILATNTETPLPSDTPTPTRTIRPTGAPYSYKIEYHASTTFRPETTCSDFIVAGSAVDGPQAIKGLIVKLGGNVPGKSFANPLTNLTGIDLAYGPSGFEFRLGVAPVESNKTLWIQLFNQSAAPISERVYLATYNDCQRNLVLVRFTQK